MRAKNDGSLLSESNSALPYSRSVGVVPIAAARSVPTAAS